MSKYTTTIFYSEIKKSEKKIWFRKDYENLKITKSCHAYKGYADSYNAEILNSFNHELQL